MDIKLTYADGEAVTHRIIPVDLVAFERHFQMGWDAVKTSPKVEHTMFLAWNAAKRCKLTTATFDKWMETVVDIGDVNGPEGGAPLQPSNAS